MDIREVIGTAAPYTTPDQWGSNTGTLYGTNGLPQLRPASECVTDGCFKFDGVDDYVECQNTDNLNIKDSITISVWLNVASDIQYIIQKETLSTIWYGYRLDIYPPNLRWYIWKDPNPPSLSTSFVNYFNKWTFVTVTYDKNVGRKIYINGNFIISDEITGSIGITSNKFRIAGDAGDQGVIGLVDDVKLYNMVLSSSQIRKEYIAGIESLYSKGIISRDKFEKRLAEL